MASFITDAYLKTRVADVLKVDETTMPPFWDNHVHNGNVSAYQDLIGILTGRGFTQSQIAAFDRGAEYQESLGLYWALLYGGALGAYGEGWERLDRRKELQTVMVMAGGIWQLPGGLTGSVEQPFTPIGVGTQDVPGTDLFSLDPADPRIGQVTQW